MDLFDDPNALVPQDLDDEESRRYEERTVAFLLEHMTAANTGLVGIDAIELVGARPETLVVFRYHHRAGYVDRHPWLAAGPCAEIAKLWCFAIDEEEEPGGTMYTPPVVAAAIGSAFDAAELPLVDPETLQPIGRPPKLFPRL